MRCPSMQSYLLKLLGGCLSTAQVLLMLLLLINQLVLYLFSLLLEVRDLKVHIADECIACLS